jgi:predicted nucleotidyltransferase
MLTEQNKAVILSKTLPLHPKQVSIFGSYASGKQTSSSDIDILIDTDSHFTLLDLIGIEQELSEALGIKVDLITRRSLSPYLKSSIENNILPLM